MLVKKVVEFTKRTFGKLDIDKISVEVDDYVLTC